MRLRTILLVLCATMMLGGGLKAQSPRVAARIAGLASNVEYMAALRRDAEYRVREDSIAGRIEVLRRDLQRNPVRHGEIAEEILKLEEDIFTLRDARGRLADRIGAIEQEWVLANLDTAAEKPAQGVSEPLIPDIPESQKRRNLVYNRYFRDNLGKEDWEHLMHAQRLEAHAARYAESIRRNYAEAVKLRTGYATVNDERAAAGMYDRYLRLLGDTERLSDSLAKVWTTIFDNKNYAYSYLLDILDHDVVLARAEDSLSSAAHRLASLRAELFSPEMTDYYMRKRVVAGFYENGIAEVLRLDAARDSIADVAAHLATMDIELRRVDIRERNFLKFDTISFSSTPVYTAKNPIPKCRVYERGTIYRILLGVFSSKRPVSIFRGTSPIFYLIDREGKWNYYAGGFATKAEADAAKVKLKDRGFLQPEVVVWNDGRFRNLDIESEGQTVAFRLEITGTESLSESMREVVARMAKDSELSRVGHRLFVVSPIEDRAKAEDLAAALQYMDSSLDIRVAEIDE